MEENSEVHMEMDVSSTTEDVLEDQQSGSHRDMKTSISTEAIEEDIKSPTMRKAIEKPQEKVLATADVPKSLPTPKVVKLRRIVIKSANKNYHIQKPALVSSDKPEVQKDDKDSKSLSPKIIKDVVDSSSITGPPKSPEKSTVTDSKSSTFESVPTTSESEPTTSARNLTPSESKSEKCDKSTTSESDSTISESKSTTSESKSTTSESKSTTSESKSTTSESNSTTSESKSTSENKPTTSESSQRAPAIEVRISVEKSPIAGNKSLAEEFKTDEHKKLINVSQEITKIVILGKDKSKSSPTPTKEQAQPMTNSPKKDHELSKDSPKIDNEPEKITTSTPAKKSPTKPQNATSEKYQSKQTTPKEPSKSIIVIRKELSAVPPVVVDKTTDKTEEFTVSTCSSVTPIEDKEASNDSQMETNSESSEKEHNKSISRELRSLIKSAKESKIISECNQVTSKTRKSRTVADSNASLNASDAADKIEGARRGSDNSQISNCSEKSDKVPVKRSMRSQKPEFVSKVKNFLSSVSGKGETDEESEVKTKDAEFAASTPKKKKGSENDGNNKKEPVKSRSDTYCWRCHWAVEPAANEKVSGPMQCTVCPRSFHYKCLSVQERNKIHTGKNWVCPECVSVLQAENSETRSPAMKKISLGMLCDLLKYALERIKEVNGVEPFLLPVDRSLFPDYDSYVVHPMDLSLMEAHIKESYYGSTEAFLADANWILHNSIIFNTLQSKLTGVARALVRSCRAEMGEIEACPECYAAAHARRPTWFTDVCSTPHVLLWAKLKGFPYWPAKGMAVNSSGMVDVRFFGQHDRAWVPAKDCFLYSEKDPNNFRSKRQDLIDSMQEAEQHIRNISRKYGKFVYPPFRTQFDPAKLSEQIKMMIPSFEGEVRSHTKDKPFYSPGTPKGNNRSDSKSSKGSHHDGEASEGEDTPVASSRKAVDNAEATKTEDSQDKDKTMEVDESPSKRKEATKRRRSELEEAVITVLDNTKDKKRRTETSDDTTENTSTPNKEPISNTTAKEQVKDGKETPKTAESKPSPSTNEKDKKAGNKQATIRVISIAKILNTAIKPNAKESTKPKPTEQSTPNEKDKGTPQEEKTKAQKRRISKSNKSLNTSTSKTSKEAEVPKQTTKDSKATPDKKDTGKTIITYEKKSAKERTKDEDVSLAVLAKKEGRVSTSTSAKSNTSNSETTPSKSSTIAKSAEVTVVTPSQSSVFTPTSTDNVKNMKEAVDKLQKLRNKSDPPPLLGRVGVRAFARMTSPPKETAPMDVQVEIKAEAIDIDDAERHSEKMDLMNAITLQPVNPNNLREVRINKVVVGPVTRKPPPKPVEIRPKAKKTFPQPKKPEEGRSELTSKNSMVYIPIQPPAPPPVGQATSTRAARANNGPVAAPPQISRANTTTTAPANAKVNTLTTPLAGESTLASPSGSNTVAVPTVGSAVHTVPLITSLNGQWTFSLQPMMSVGGLDSAKSPPIVNGVGERAVGTSLLPPVTRTTDNPPREPPRLQQRPLSHPLDPGAPAVPAPPPSTAGPVTAKLNQAALKLTDFFRTLLEESLERLDEPAAQLTAARAQLEQLRWRHQQDISEIRHNHELTIAEMRASFEKEKTRLLLESRRCAQTALDEAVKHTKSKQWCARCSQEAQFYCCWNTSYCDYPCQREHWAQHHSVCAQRRSQDGDGSSMPSENRLQAAPEKLPKTTAAPNLTVGGKLAPSRVYTQEMTQKPSIIMSMVEEGGTQTMKYVGTYKPPATAAAPVIINKQMLSNEDASKKVVTSGGYLIVGAANAPTAPASGGVVTPGRRVQYFS